MFADNNRYTTPELMYKVYKEQDNNPPMCD